MCTRSASRERCHDPLTPAAKEVVCDKLCTKRFCSVGLQADIVDSSTGPSRTRDGRYTDLTPHATQTPVSSEYFCRARFLRLVWVHLIPGPARGQRPARISVVSFSGQPNCLTWRSSEESNCPALRFGALSISGGVRTLRAVPPGRAGFPLAVRLAKWRTLAGEWRVLSGAREQ